MVQRTQKKWISRFEEAFPRLHLLDPAVVTGATSAGTTLPNYQIPSGIFMTVRAASPLALGGSPFQDHVLHVVVPRSDEQVSYVATGRVVAAVAEIHSGRNSTDLKYPSDTVCEPCNPIYVDLPVLPMNTGTSPNPAGIVPTGYIDFRPEALGKSTMSGHRRSPFAVSGDGLHERRVPIILPDRAA